MSMLSVLATIFGSLMGLANLPQAYRIFKRKSAKDISILTFSILFVGATIWVFYGIEIDNFAVILSNSIGVFAVVLILIGWYLYGR